MKEPTKDFHLFDCYGVELEYMIVDKKDLAVAPISDQVLQAIAGEITSDVELGEIAWSNELVMHVIELKTNGPSSTLSNLPALFQKNIININNILQAHDAKLLPTGVHPLMKPDVDTKLWPHDDNTIYEAFNKIFNCQGHGWSNLQSVHLNLPFANDEEFVQLHSAIRLLLPIIPALSASSPIIDGKKTGFVDTRLEYYRTNQQKIPSISGMVIPEAISSIAHYHEKILQTIYRDIAQYDHNNILQQEWLNSRGAIARFDRNTIEIRIVDIQECPQADLAILALIISSLQVLVKQHWLDLKRQLQFDEAQLSAIFLAVIKEGQNAVISDEKYLQAFGYKGQSATAKELWTHITLDNAVSQHMDPIWFSAIELILAQGNLSERISQALEKYIYKDKIIEVYQLLADCLQNGKMFIP